MPSTKKALIISYYFPPCHGSAPWRSYSWVTYFKELGIFPTLLTRHWLGTEQKWADYINDIDKAIEINETTDYKTINVPSKKRWLYRFVNQQNFLSKCVRPVYFIASKLLGVFSTEVDAYYSFYNYVRKLVSTEEFDFIIVTGPPHNVFKFIPMLHENSEAKIIADFRDVWDNYIGSPAYRPTVTKRIFNAVDEFYLKKWLRHADIVTVITPAFVPLVQSIFKGRVEVNFNGFEEEYHLNAPARINNYKFTFSMIGSLYPLQDTSILIAGLQEFIKDKSAETVQINMIGQDNSDVFLNTMRQVIPSTILTISGRVPKKEATHITRQSDVLFYPAWKGYYGQIGVKPLDYLASGNNILVAPGDNDILDKVILECKAGKIANSVSEFVEIMNNWYYEWKQNGHCTTHHDMTKVYFYSRKNQAINMAKLLQGQPDA
ncbi:MAG: hypothetical protein IPO27_02455 [Bacteroidetes bacterium]|nr:hypothetical protein [Bacteroidota bacterium]